MTVTIDSKTLNIMGGGFTESVKAVGTFLDDWQNESYLKDVKVFGAVRSWSLQCYEKGVNWADSTAKHLETLIKNGDPVAFVVSEGNLHDISTDVYVLPLDLMYGAKKNFRSFHVEFQEKAFSPPLQSDLVLCLPFEEGQGSKTYDKSGYGNNGTLYQGPSWVNGRFGKALSFDGVDDYVTVSNVGLELDGKTVGSICMWIKRTSHVAWRNFISFRTTADTYGFRFEDVNVEGRIYWYDESSNPLIPTDRPLWDGTTTNVWHFLCFVADGTNVKTYLNGVYQRAIGITGTFNTKNMWIGQRYGIGLFWNGLIDEVRIYNRALSPEEIRAHYLSTVIIDGVPVCVQNSTRALTETVQPVGTPVHKWENEQYKKEVAVQGSVRGWSLNCYEQNVSWSNSVLRFLHKKLSAGSPQVFIVNEPGLHELRTNAYLTELNTRYRKGAKASGFVRYFDLKLREAP